MHTIVKYLSGACAGVMLLACAGGGQPPRLAQPLPAPLAQEPDGYYVLGRRQYAAGRYAEALNSYRKVLRIDPGHVNARNGLAVLAASQGDYGSAIALWQALAAEGGGATRPETAFLFSNLGYVYFLSGANEPALAALEKACVLDPLNALAWEHLGQVLEKTGQSERAALMFKQARTLRTHDLTADYALTRPDGIAPAPAVAPSAATASIWPDSMPRIEVTQAGGIAHLRRVAPVPQALPARPALPVAAASANAPLRLEIRNGNGVTGMAAALARTVASERLQVVRLLNERNFLVERTRVEYRPQQEQAARALAARLGPSVATEESSGTRADLCVVLGHDLLDPAALQRYYLKRLKPGGLG